MRFVARVCYVIFCISFSSQIVMLLLLLFFPVFRDSEMPRIVKCATGVDAIMYAIIYLLAHCEAKQEALTSPHSPHTP